MFPHLAPNTVSSFPPDALNILDPNPIFVEDLTQYQSARNSVACPLFLTVLYPGLSKVGMINGKYLQAPGIWTLWSF